MQDDARRKNIIGDNILHVAGGRVLLDYSTWQSICRRNCIPRGSRKNRGRKQSPQLGLKYTDEDGFTF